MSYLNSKSNSYPTSPGKAIHFFSHFPRNYLRPYGQAEEAPTDQGIFTRLHSGNYEWLVRPSVAISEFALTMNRNMELLAERPTLLQTDVFEDINNNMSSFLETLGHFDSKQGSVWD